MTAQRIYNTEEDRAIDLSQAVQRIYEAKEELQVQLEAQEDAYFRGNGYDADEVLVATLALVADLQTLKAIETATIIDSAEYREAHKNDDFEFSGFFA